MPKCRLCNEETKLIRAHIIPESFLGLPADPNEPAKIMSNSAGVFPRRTRTGIYDENILCSDCDNRLGVYDQHATEQLTKNAKVRNFYERGRLLVREYPNADPDLVWNFVTSVLWRASVCSLAFFDRVMLGPYEELLRKMLLGEIPRDERVQAMLAEFDKDDVSILNPHSTRTEQVLLWLIYANRFILYTKTDRRRCPDVYSMAILQPGRAVTSLVRPWEESKEYPLIVKIAHTNPDAFRTTKLKR